MDVIEVAVDTCDECPAEAHVQAYIFARLESGRSLSWCIHHGRTHLAALAAQNATVIDLSHALCDKA